MDNSPEQHQHKQKAWEHLCTVIVLVAEFLAVKYSIVWLAWCASLFLCFAIWNYARLYLSGRYAKSAIVLSVAVIIAGTYYLTKERKDARIQAAPAASAEPERQPQTQANPQPPVKHPAEKQRHAPPKQGQSNSRGTNNQQSTNGDNSPNIGSITQGAGSIAQVGNNNTATVNNGPPPLTFSISWEPRSENMPGCNGVTTDVTMTPNQPVSAPFDLTFDLDIPSSESGPEVKGVRMFLGTGSHRDGYHPLEGFGTGIDPLHPAINPVCTTRPIFRASNAHIEGR